GHKTVTYLTLQGNDQNDMLPALCEVLRHPECNLRYLGLVSCSTTTQQWADLSLALEVNQSLTAAVLSIWGHRRAMVMPDLAVWNLSLM
ncbi:NLRP2 isoform 10, partial [Pongo abelii]